MVIDFHTHILPGIDDGSANIATSLEMLRMEKEQGITHVIATPHFYPRHDMPERFLQMRDEAQLKLCQAMGDREIFPQLHVGAEVYYYNGISDSDALPALTIGNSKCILIEMPMQPWTGQMYAELAGIYEKQGLVPIIAHLDRYIRPMHCGAVVRALEDLPVLVQANAESFLRRSTRQMMMRLLRNGQIHLLGSDCHDLQRRKPDLGEAVELIRQNLGLDAIAHIQHFESKLLQNV